MAFYTRAWFWLLIVAIIFILVAVIGYESTRPTTPWWVWMFMFFGVILLPVAAIVGYLGHSKQKIKLVAAEETKTSDGHVIKAAKTPSGTTVGTVTTTQPFAVPPGYQLVPIPAAQPFPVAPSAQAIHSGAAPLASPVRTVVSTPQQQLAFSPNYEYVGQALNRSVYSTPAVMTPGLMLSPTGSMMQSP